MSINDDDLNWRVEQACREGWPAATEQVADGWLLRRSGGRVRRPNSVNPLRGKRAGPAEAFSAAEAFYADYGQTPLFRVPSIADEMDAVLDRHGYATEGGTIHLYNDIEDMAQVRDEQVIISSTPSENWFDARFRMESYDEAERRIFREMTTLIVGDRAFVSCEQEGMIVAIAFGVIRDGLLVVESVGTDGRFRQQGLGRSTVGNLIDWAQRAGASAACLQVVADNTPARALYASLGFSRELYRYHYRRKAVAA
ncbi:GNAT family N-acetyltransferase [Mesorhizobium sp. Cs1299R1N3]|uniref:GNAT family N-acetyltransferase n=1 Tax=Mesorhizobium sp. Cs1299R1N3 TaxID=3015173 RepID=UPI00301C662C